ncbi:alkaline phosphatase family protein [Natronolimnohabitans sp. A-GB9]|uniref:alkaline phosphatase family protein n=1 Tax=Natronolimnohabitans sp. A-GB9 TaxID=3069757 RepID=UPI0027B4016D|nr:alkaline phosphatase family protein [Natronolimnohabitans sp. A-GB9]MDQ2049189.1 alkaline phosphatase family protein [Natronolimnohabitans sp. A-GB9]
MRTDLERRLRDRQTENGYLFPDYDGYCFAGVPDTVASVLGADGVARRPLPDDVLEGVGDVYDRVLVVVVDGFGLEFWKRHSHPLLERLESEGTVSPLTATYPSETAAAMTTFHTGRLPASHGAIGWDIYDPVADASYEAFTGEVKAGDESVDPELQAVFEGEPIYPALADAGIDSHHVVPFADTYDGAVAHSYQWNRDVQNTDDTGSLSDRDHQHESRRDHVIEGFGDALEDAFAAADDPASLFAYLPQIDAAAHASGTDSTAYRETVATTFDTLERALSRLDRNDTDAGETLVVVTADHGHVDTDPDRNVDLERYDGVMARLERHATGEPVRYAGSPRNLHLHLRDPDRTRDRVQAILEEQLEARIFTREDALERGLFGDGPTSETFRRRLGDLVVCHRDRSVWFGSDRDHLELVGVHGGLHPDEMLVPFAASDLASLCHSSRN